MFNQIVRRSISSSVPAQSRLIKFRYAAAKNPQNTTTNTNKTNQPAQQNAAVIWDFDLPPRFRRRGLDEDEIAVINNGGPL